MNDIAQWKLDLIAQNLAKQNVTVYDTRNGNACVWVSYGRIDAYYMFNETTKQIANIVID